MKVRISLLFEEGDTVDDGVGYRLHFDDGSSVELTHAGPTLDALPERFDLEEFPINPPGPQAPTAPAAEDNT